MQQRERFPRSYLLTRAAPKIDSASRLPLLHARACALQRVLPCVCLQLARDVVSPTVGSGCTSAMGLVARSSRPPSPASARFLRRLCENAPIGRPSTTWRSSMAFRRESGLSSLFGLSVRSLHDPLGSLDARIRLLHALIAFTSPCTPRIAITLVML